MTGLEFFLGFMASYAASGAWEASRDRASFIVSWIRGDVRYLNTRLAASHALANLIRRSKTPGEIWISAGFLDMAEPLIRAVIDDAQATPRPVDKVTRVYVRMLNRQLVQRLQQDGGLVSHLPSLIDSTFESALMDNLKRLATSLEPHGIQLSCGHWSGLPPFHGFIYGDTLAEGPWTVDRSGHLGVRATGLLLSRRRANDRHFTERLDSIREGSWTSYRDSPWFKA